MTSPFLSDASPMQLMEASYLALLASVPDGHFKALALSSAIRHAGDWLNDNGLFKQAITTLAKQANKTMFSLFKTASHPFHPKPTLMCHLF